MTMKNTLTKGEFIFTKSGLKTNLAYVRETVYQKNVRFVQVQCICGDTLEKPLASIRGGAISSCGKPECKLKTAPTLKKLFKVGDSVTDCFTYVGEDLVKSTTNHRHILVKCGCGNQSSIRIDAVGRNVCCRSCGLKKRRATFHDKHQLALQRSVYSTYKRQALKRGYAFEISFEDFLEIIQKDCNYCGDPPSNCFKSNGRELYYNGLDRVINNMHYTIDNVVPCCGTCNMMKNKFDRTEFLQKLQKIINYQKA